MHSIYFARHGETDVYKRQIQPYCDITYSIVRHGDVNAIAPFYRLNASEEIGS